MKEKKKKELLYSARNIHPKVLTALMCNVMRVLVKAFSITEML
jgi:hypothetical protein